MEVSTGSSVGHPETSQWSTKECRACLYKPEQTIHCFNLFEAWPYSCPGMGQTLAADLAKLCYVQIENGDGLSDVICQLCVEHLNNAMTFISLVQSNDKILRNRLHNLENSNWPKPIQIDKNLTEFAPKHMEIKEEVLSENEMNTAEEYDNISFGEIKIEPEEIVMPTMSNVEINGLQENWEEGTANGVMTDNNFSTTIKQEPNSDEEELIPVPLDCLLCTKSFKCVSGLKAHVIALHSYKGVKRKSSTNTSPVKKVANHVCKICRRTFTTPTDLMVHETCHNKSVCYSCNKSFDTFQQLTKHRTRCKAAKAEVVKPKTLEDALRHQEETRTATEENFKCSQCNEQFTDIFYLQVHQEIHNTDAIEFNIKFESDSDLEEGRSKNKTDSVKDDLEKMLQADDTADTVDTVRDSLEKLLQSNEGTSVTSNKNKRFSDQYPSKEKDREIEADIVKESLQKLLQSDDSMDSLNETHRNKSVMVKSKLVNDISNIQENKQTQDEKDLNMVLETDEVKESLQELFKSDRVTESSCKSDTAPLDLLQSNNIENEKSDLNLCALQSADGTNASKLKLLNDTDENLIKLENDY